MLRDEYETNETRAFTRLCILEREHIAKHMQQSKGIYQMTGLVYYSDASSCCVSNGGLLAKIPKALNENNRVYMSVSMSKVRRRETAREESRATRSKKTG